MAVQIVMCRP